MLYIKSILNLLALGSVMVDNPWPERILSKIIYVVATVILSVMLIGTLLIALIAYAYQAMVSHGYAPMDAALYTVGITFAVTALVLLATVASVKGLIGVVRLHSKKPVPLTEHISTHATTMAEAFVNGLIDRYRKPKRNFSDKNFAEYP